MNFNENVQCAVFYCLITVLTVYYHTVITIYFISMKHLPQVDDPPEISPEPHGSAAVGLVLPDQYRVRDWQ